MGRPPAADLAFAVGFTAAVAVGTIPAATEQDGAVPVGAFGLVVVAGLGTIGLRRAAPAWALTIAMVTVPAYIYLGYPFGPVQLCMVVGMFELARQRPLRISLPACGISAVVATASVLSRALDEADSPVLFGLAWTSWIVLPWSLGALVHVAAAARDRARRDLAARAALEERMRIAGEVHDVVGHGLAVVSMQAGVALLVFDEQPEQARRSLEAIRTTSATSLTELRGMLDAVHPGQSEKDAGIADLIDRVRAGGLSVELTADLDAVDRDTGAIAYRIVQESLTNVVRHAATSSAEVQIIKQDNELLVQVRDRGRGPVGTGEGRGLAGMRKRVEAAGGTFESGPRHGGGFQVVATLPLDGTSR
jgi:signal transduction histidine kinase